MYTKELKYSEEAFRDMYEALTICLNAMRGIYVDTGLHGKVGETVERIIEKALQKAEGK